MFQNYAVLTGDLVRSGKMVADLRKVQKLLTDIPDEFNKVYDAAIIGKVSLYRGDGWQLLLRNKELAIRLALYIKAVLKSEYDVKTRLVIGIGQIDNVVEDNISASGGEAFELSGKGLDNLDKNCELKLIDHTCDRDSEISLLDCLIGKLSERQAEALRYALLGCKQDEIAKKLKDKTKTGNITQQTVAALLKKSCWRVIQEMLNKHEHL